MLNNDYIQERIDKKSLIISADAQPLRMTKKKEKPKKEAPKKVVPVKHEEPTSDENPFDFGGLPPRDLKKNLGCS